LRQRLLSYKNRNCKKIYSEEPAIKDMRDYTNKKLKILERI